MRKNGLDFRVLLSLLVLILVDQALHQAVAAGCQGLKQHIR